jgi:hypothetical protein
MRHDGPVLDDAGRWTITAPSWPDFCSEAMPKMRRRKASSVLGADGEFRHGGPVLIAEPGGSGNCQPLMYQVLLQNFSDWLRASIVADATICRNACMDGVRWTILHDCYHDHSGS